MAKKGKKTERDTLSGNNKMLTNLLLWEATGGMVSLPKGAENYIPPPIPFSERRALIDSVNKQLMVDMKIDPVSEETGFEMLKEELNERKRFSNKDSDRGLSAEDEDAGEPDDTFAGGASS